jgi:hypothetical protein
MTEHKQVLVKHDLVSLEVDEGIAPLMERLLKLNIKTTNSCEDNIPKGWVWVEFLSSYQAERFLSVVSKYSPDIDCLYNRIRQHWVPEDSIEEENLKSTFWKYSVNPVDYGVESTFDEDCIIETFKGPHYFKFLVSVRFPRSDLKEVIQNLDDYLNEFKKEEEIEKKENLEKPVQGTWKELKKLLK